MTDGFAAFDYTHYAKTRAPGARFPLNLSAVPSAALATFLSAEDHVAPIEPSALGGAIAEFRERIAARYDVPASDVCPALGTSGGVFLAIAALASRLPRGATIATERPAYAVFETCARFVGRDVVQVDRNRSDHAVDVGAVAHAFEQGARVFCLTDLHNPTGVAISDGEMQALRDLARRFDGWILVDEVYRDFRDGAVGTAYRPGERALCTSSLTKCYGLGGLRAGFVFAPPEVVERIALIEEIVYGDLPTPSAHYAARALEHADELLARGRAVATSGRRTMDAWMASTSRVAWTPPAAGITGLVRIEGLTDSMRFAERLRAELDVQVVPGAYFGAEGHVRISFGLPPEQLQPALDVLAMGIPPLAR